MVNTPPPADPAVPPSPTPREPLAVQLRQAADMLDVPDQWTCGGVRATAVIIDTIMLLRQAADALTRTQAVVDAARAHRQALDTLRTLLPSATGKQVDAACYHVGETERALCAALAATHPAGGPEAEAPDPWASDDVEMDDAEQAYWDDQDVREERDDA